MLRRAPGLHRAPPTNYFIGTVAVVLWFVRDTLTLQSFFQIAAVILLVKALLAPVTLKDQCISMTNISYFLVFWHMQLYMSWYIISFFWLYLYFLNILYFFKYSCTNIFHRRSLSTLYMTQFLRKWVNHMTTSANLGKIFLVSDIKQLTG